ASWPNNSGSPVTSFSTEWVVPREPATASGQTIFLSNGLQGSSLMLQPVLQWGCSAAGGGDHWAVASWCIGGPGGPALCSALVPVSRGDSLVGTLTLTRSEGELAVYQCGFDGIDETLLDIEQVEELTWCAQVLEAYAMSKCSDYPATARTAMRAISIETD